MGPKGSEETREKGKNVPDAEVAVAEGIAPA